MNMPPNHSYSSSKYTEHAREIQEEYKSSKPHWSQWLPLYGIGRMILDDLNSKPTILMHPAPSKLRSYAVGTWHGSSSVGLMVGIVKGLEFLLQKM